MEKAVEEEVEEEVVAVAGEELLVGPWATSPLQTSKPWRRKIR